MFFLFGTDWPELVVWLLLVHKELIATSIFFAHRNPEHLANSTNGAYIYWVGFADGLCLFCLSKCYFSTLALSLWYIIISLFFCIFTVSGDFFKSFSLKWHTRSKLCFHKMDQWLHFSLVWVIRKTMILGFIFPSVLARGRGGWNIQRYKGGAAIWNFPL